MISVEVRRQWDYEADVIAVGAGTAELPTAAVAAEAGVKAAVLELMSYCASSLGKITGLMNFAGKNSKRSKAKRAGKKRRQNSNVKLR